MMAGDIDRATVLFIDIDGTLLRRRADVDPPPAVLGHELLRLMVDEAVRLRRCPRPEAMQRVQAIMSGKVWWDWRDYLRTLALDEGDFWALAGQREAEYLEACHARLAEQLHSLATEGFRCFITSNNPASGIRHKLRLAGLERDLFIDCLGTDRMEAMKGSVGFWRRALESAGARAREVIIIGDDPHDDVAVPRQAGIRRHVVIHQPPREPWAHWSGVTLATDWSEVPACVRQLATQPINDDADIPVSPLIAKR